MTVTIRPALMADAYAIELRASDLHEGSIWVPGWSAAAVLKNTIQHATQALTAEEDGRVLAVFGFTAHEGQVTPWLMCADLELRHHKLLLKVTRDLLAALRRDFPGALISNFVARDNAQARGFLTHLGFRIVPSPGNSEFDFFHLPHVP